MRKFYWSRPNRTARNWLVVLVFLLLWYAVAGFPALTKGQLARQVMRQNLLSGGEVIYEDEDGQGHRQVYLQCGDAFLRFSYTRAATLIGYTHWEADLFSTEDGILCIPSREQAGVVLAMGNVEDAQTAVLELAASQDRSEVRPMRYRADGVGVSDKVIAFTLSHETYPESERLFETLRTDGVQEAYYDYTVWLYDESGNLLRTSGRSAE